MNPTDEYGRDATLFYTSNRHDRRRMFATHTSRAQRKWRLKVRDLLYRAKLKGRVSL